MKEYTLPKSEHGIQSAGFNWVRRNRKNSNLLITHAMELCHAIPNGLSTKESQKAKMEGLTKGIPDIHLPWPKAQCIEKHAYDRLGGIVVRMIKDGQFFKFVPGLYIEMKYGKNKLSSAQEEKRDLLLALGYAYRVCYSTEEMIQCIMNYLPFPESDYLSPEYL